VKSAPHKTLAPRSLRSVYVGIDTMALLAAPPDQKYQTRHDFIAWGNRYLKSDAASDYQYEGTDVYAARCAVLHSYGSVAAAHQDTNPPRKFGYVDSGPHRKDDANRFVLVSVASLIHDFAKAMEEFIDHIRTDAGLKRRVDSRIGSLFLTTLIDLSHHSSRYERR
jgi:hypothetical protein